MYAINDIRPIFIAGSERSGTTLVRLMLHAHPRIAIPPQTKYLRKVYKRRLLFGNLNYEKNRRKLASWFTAHFDGSTKLDDLNIDLGEVEENILSSKTLGAAMAVPWKCYAAQDQKERWGDKRPYYIHQMEKLRTLYPDAQIIHVIRDCRDVISSLKKMPWWCKPLEYSILNWKSAIRHGNAARHNTRLDEYIEIKYEDLVCNTKPELERLCQFLGENYDPEMLQFQKVARSSVPDYKVAWHGATREPLNRQSVKRWERDLSDDEVSLIEWAVGDDLAELGYSLSRSDKAPTLEAKKYYKQAKRKFRFENLLRNFADKLISYFYTGNIDYRLN